MSTNAKLFGISLLFIISLTACGTVTPYAPKPTITLTISKTPEPATGTPTVRPSSTATISPIGSYIQNMQKMLGECAQVYLSSSTKSPDGNWTAYPCHTELLIINKDGSMAWHLVYNQFSSRNSFGSEHNLVANQLNLIHWSGDSQYLYFYPMFPPTRPCCWDPDYGPIDTTFDEMWQLNLKTGAYFNVFENIGSAKNDDYPRLSTIYFSPDDKTVLIIPQLWTPPLVYVYDLETNEVIHLFQLIASSKNIAAGNVVWSADGQRFVLASASGGNLVSPNEEWQFSIIAVDLKTMSQKAIISNEKGSYITLRAITDENILLLESVVFTETSWGPTVYKQYDLKTDQFLIPTP